MRKPIAIGFYPSDRSELKSLVTQLLKSKRKFKNAVACVVPHAGYVFSGDVAGEVYASIETKKRVFLIACPNHTGIGEPVALSLQDWETPLGVVKNAKLFTKELTVDESAHRYEHSLEVQLPFLQVRFQDFELVPICLAHLPFDKIETLAKKLTRENIFYIAISDFTHFAPSYGYMPFFHRDLRKNVEEVKKLDKKAISYLLNLDAHGFYEHVVKTRATICGFVPITLITLIAKELGARKGVLLKYKTSFDVRESADFVAYAGIVFTK